MAKILLFDSYDSFTYNLKDYLEQEGAEVVVVKNDELTLPQINMLSFNGLVISPGPQKPEDSGILMEVLAYYHNRIPILGVCLGHQAIGLYNGLKLVRADKPMHGKVSEITLSNDQLFEGMPSKIEVCRYHSLILNEDEDVDVSIIARSTDGIMAIKNNKFPVWGVQYHPEAILTQFGHRLLRNWLKVVTLRSH